MTTVDYLRQVRILDTKINNRLIEIEQAKKLACSIAAVNYSNERVQTTPNFDRIGSALCKIEKMQENLNNLIDTFVDKKEVILNQIENLESEIHREILYKRYVEGKRLVEIEEEISYSYRNLQRHHNKAIMKFEAKYGDLYLND